VVKWIGGSLTREFLGRCNAPVGSEAREEVFRYAPCLNSIAKEQRKCYDLVRLPMEYMFTQRYDKRVPIGCCAVRKTIQCLHSIAEKKCGKQSADFISRFYPIEDFTETICEGNRCGAMSATTVLMPFPTFKFR